MMRTWLLLGVTAGLLAVASASQAGQIKKKKNAFVTGVVQSITADMITIKGYEEQSDGSAVNFEKKLKLTPETKFVNVAGNNKKAEKTAASRTDVREGMKVAFVAKDGSAEKIMIPQKRKKNK